MSVHFSTPFPSLPFLSLLILARPNFLLALILKSLSFPQPNLSSAWFRTLDPHCSACENKVKKKHCHVSNMSKEPFHAIRFLLYFQKHERNQKIRESEKKLSPRYFFLYLKLNSLGGARPTWATPEHFSHTGPPPPFQNIMVPHSPTNLKIYRGKVRKTKQLHKKKTYKKRKGTERSMWYTPVVHFGCVKICNVVAVYLQKGDPLRWSKIRRAVKW